MSETVTARGAETKPEPDYAALKKGGFMRQVQKACFSMRLRVIGGRMDARRLRKISEIAEKYGEGYVHMTSRQGIEIPFIKLADIDAVLAELASAGLQPGACGPRVRTVTACQGASVCPSGLIETDALAKELDGRYFGRELPHKFKIGVTGCKNNCLKAEENDLGVKGGVMPEWDGRACNYCALCQAVCPVRAVRVDQSAQTLAFDEASCVYCGKCIKSCPAGAWTGRNGYIVSFGGMFGNEFRRGRQLLPILFEKEALLRAIDGAIEFYELHGRASERFAMTIERVGEHLLAETLLQNGDGNERNTG